jgi:hypothetical protein
VTGRVSCGRREPGIGARLLVLPQAPLGASTKIGHHMRPQLLDIL